MINALESLWTLGSLDDEGMLTDLGRKMAEFPMEPALSKMLLTSVDLRRLKYTMRSRSSLSDMSDYCDCYSSNYCIIILIALYILLSL